MKGVGIVSCTKVSSIEVFSTWCNLSIIITCLVSSSYFHSLSPIAMDGLFANRGCFIPLTQFLSQ